MIPAKFLYFYYLGYGAEVLPELPEPIRGVRHDFHKNCIDPWLLEHRTCPMCKMDILKHYGFVFTGIQESLLQLEVEEARSRALSPARNRHPLTLLTSDSSYEEAGSERSSRASSPDELVPSLARTCDPPRHVSRSCTSSPSGSPRADTSRQEGAGSSISQE